MTFPRAIAEALRNVDPDTLPGAIAADAECEGAKFHSPTPLLLHEVALPGDRTAILCGICRDNSSVLSALMVTFAEELEWPVRREFGNRLRALLIPKETESG